MAGAGRQVARAVFTTRIVGVAIVVAVAAVSCGSGSGRLSLPEYVKDSSAICAQGNRRVARVSIPRGARDAHGVSVATARVVAIHRHSVESLRDLRAPKDYEGNAELWVALVDQSLDELDAMRDALRTRDWRAARSYHDKAVALDDRSGEIARVHAITPCRVPVLMA